MRGFPKRHSAKRRGRDVRRAVGPPLFAAVPASGLNDFWASNVPDLSLRDSGQESEYGLMASQDGEVNARL